MTTAAATDVPSITDLRKLGTRTLATYILDLWGQRTREVKDELTHIERAALNANLDRWIETQNAALAEMNANVADFSTKGRAIYWTARETFDRASVEVDRAFRRLQEPHAPSEPPAEPQPSKPKARLRKKNDQPQES